MNAASPGDVISPIFFTFLNRFPFSSLWTRTGMFFFNFYVLNICSFLQAPRLGSHKRREREQKHKSCSHQSSYSKIRRSAFEDFAF